MHEQHQEHAWEDDGGAVRAERTAPVLTFPAENTRFALMFALLDHEAADGKPQAKPTASRTIDDE
jgi:hypothetical protein